MGQSRRFRAAPKESGPPPTTDIRCQRLTLVGLDLTVRRYRALRSASPLGQTNDVGHLAAGQSIDVQRLALQGFGLPDHMAAGARVAGKEAKSGRAAALAAAPKHITPMAKPFIYNTWATLVAGSHRDLRKLEQCWRLHSLLLA
jgi:hypothetical protein